MTRPDRPREPRFASARTPPKPPRAAQRTPIESAKKVGRTAGKRVERAVRDVLDVVADAADDPETSTCLGPSLAFF